MKAIRTTLTLFSLLLLAGLQAQSLEIGIMGGGAVYSGDLSPADGGINSADINAAGGVYLRYRPTERFGFRVTGTFGRLSGAATRRVINDDFVIVPVDRNFRTPLTEFMAAVELDLFYVGDKDYTFAAPFITAGVGRMSFDPEGEIDGIYERLQPLATEGQGLGGPVYDDAPYDLNVTTLMLGGGVRLVLNNQFTLGVEVGGRVPGTDYIDDVSDTRVRYNDILNNTGATAARFSNPEVDSDVPDSFTYVRGGEFDDFYYVGTLTLGIRIGGGGGGRGRGGRGKTGCYTF